MPPKILLSVDKARMSVAPGASVELAVTVQNLTTLLDQVMVRLEGIDPDWVQVIPPRLVVFEQGEAVARVIVRPPRDSSRSAAGTYPIRVRGASQESPGEEGEAATELGVELVGSYVLAVRQGEASSLEQASYPVEVTNDANAPLRIQFSASDAEGALLYKFDPFLVTVPPGGTAAAVLTVLAPHAPSERRTIPFTLTSQGEYLLVGGERSAARVQEIPGQFIQIPLRQLTVAVEPAQGEVTGAAGGVYKVRLSNPGLTPASIYLVATDATDSLDFRFEPGQLTLDPQSETRVNLAVQSRLPPAPGEQRLVTFRVTAFPLEGKVQPSSAEARLVQIGEPKPSPPPNGRSCSSVFGGVLLAGLSLLVSLAVLMQSGRLH